MNEDYSLGYEDGFKAGQEDMEKQEKVLAQQCVCGEPNSSGTHRTDGPCLAPQPEQEPTRSEKMRDAGITRRPKGWDKESDEPEPVVWMYQDKSTHEVRFQKHMRDFVDHGATYETPLYTTPPQRTWVGLTVEEIKNTYFTTRADFVDYAQAIEAKLKEKNT